MKAYSIELRAEMVLAYENGEGTLDEIAALFGVRRCTVARVLHLYRAGLSLAPKPHGGGRMASLDNTAQELLRQQVTRVPDATLREASRLFTTSRPRAGASRDRLPRFAGTGLAAQKKA